MTTGTDKQQLSEALAEIEGNRLRYDFEVSALIAAARLVERLLPGDCPCGGTGIHPNDEPWPDPDCHGSGRVWDEGIVEAVRRPIQDGLWESDDAEDIARAVLSALVELLTEKVEK